MKPATSLRAVMLAAVIAVTLAPGPASAMDATDEEWALLPAWCAYTLPYDGQRDVPRHAEYLARYGPAFSHMHHYCWAMIREMRSMNPRVAAHLRRTHQTSALGDYDYVLQRTKPDFGLRLDTLRRKAALLQRMGEVDKAIAVGQQAVKEFPEDASAYIAAASAYLTAKRRDLAEQVLAAGAEKASDPAQIQRARSALLGR